MFNSSRLARFCLESVLQRDTDVDEPADLLELTKSGLRPDDFLACLQLRDVGAILCVIYRARLLMIAGTQQITG